MRKTLGMSGVIFGLAFFLQACTIPPAPIKWRTDPGRIQQIDRSALSPAATNHAMFVHEMN